MNSFEEWNDSVITQLQKFDFDESISLSKESEQFYRFSQLMTLESILWLQAAQIDQPEKGMKLKNYMSEFRNTFMKGSTALALSDIIFVINSYKFFLLQWHFTYIIKKGEYLRFRKTDTLILFNGELFFKRIFFSLTFVKAFCQYWNGLTLHNTSP